MGPDTLESPAAGGMAQTTKLLERRWVSKKAFEIRLSRPSSFVFAAGQTICLHHKGIERYYSIISGIDDPIICLFVRFIEKGVFSNALATAEPGTQFRFTGPHGYFTFKPSKRPVIFVATGTGIAPFVSMAKTGVTGFTLFHGVSATEDLYYRDQFQSAAKEYLPCVTDTSPEISKSFGFYNGRVTEGVARYLAPAQYDFYLCGRQEMIRDVTHLVDERFPGSYIYSETFF